MEHSLTLEQLAIAGGVGKRFKNEQVGYVDSAIAAYKRR